MRVELYREVPDSENLRRAWNVLAMRTGSPEVFYTHEWGKAVDVAYGASLRPWVLLAYEGEELTGVAAMALDSKNRATFLAGTTADYCDFLSLPEKRGSLLDIVFEELSKADANEIVLANLPAGSATTSCLRTVGRRHGLHVFSRLGYVCARINLGSADDRSQLKQSLKKKKNLRYGMNALGRDGPVTLRHLRSWSEVHNALPEFYEAHVARFLVTSRISNFARADRRAFIAALSQRLSTAGWLALTQLTVGDRAIAWNYGFRFQSSWFYYQPTFESRLEQYSPGQCLLAAIVTEACDSSAISVVDLGLGAEGYKERFANDSRKTLTVTLSRFQRRHLRAVARYRLAETLKQWPWVESSIRGALTHIGSAKRHLKSEGPVRFTTHVSRRLMDSVAIHEVRFYEWDDTNCSAASAELGNLDLHPMELRLLARAVMTYEGDEETRAYLLRCAQRLKSDRSQGFVATSGGRLVQFCWIAPFEGFFVPELRTTLRNSDPDMTIVFDPFTPASARRRGYYRTALNLLGKKMSESGKKLWAFSTTGNEASTRGIETANFLLRYAMVSRRTAAGRGVTKLDLPSPTADNTTVRS